MELVLRSGEFELYKYTPTVLKPFYIDMEPTTLMRRFRFLIDLYYGYKVFYLKKSGEIVGYCTITSGKNPRFWFADDKDIIVGPYYVDEKHRGRGYSTLMADMVIHRCETSWHKAYLYILNDNKPSIRVVQKLGGKCIFHVHNTIYRKLVKTDDGEYGIYLIERDV